MGRAIESVLNQSYQPWELLVVDLPGRATLEPTDDERIRFIDADGATVWDRIGVGVGAATGDHVVLLGQYATLDERALQRVAACGGDVDLIYSDEIVAGEGDAPDEAVFKPAWSPHLLLSGPYIGDLLCLRKDAVTAIGGLNPTLGPAMWHDLLLRLSETDPTVVHLPDLLYRSKAGGCPNSSADETVVDSALRRRGWRATTVSADDGTVAVVWDLGESSVLVKVVIPTRDRADLLAVAVDGVLHRTAGVRIHLVIIDNGSIDSEAVEFLDKVAGRDDVTVIRVDEPFNFSRLCNIGFDAGPVADHVVFLNNDVRVIDPRWLTQLLGWFTDPSVIAVGPMLCFPDGTIQHAGVVIAKQSPEIGTDPKAHRAIAGHFAHGLEPHTVHPILYRSARDVSALTAACLVVDSQAFREVGGFDEALAVDFQDVDLCLRLGAPQGRMLVYDPRFPLEHEQSASRGFEGASSPETLALLETRWGATVDEGDRYFSPHLGLDLELAPIPGTADASVVRAVAPRRHESGSGGRGTANPSPG